MLFQAFGTFKGARFWGTYGTFCSEISSPQEIKTHKQTLNKVNWCTILLLLIVLIARQRFVQ